MNDKTQLTGDAESWYNDEGVDEDDREHLLQVLQEVRQYLDVLWRAAEPALARNASRNLLSTCNWSYWRVFDGLTHSVEWLQAMPRRASDGTRVWEALPAAAVTNEPEVRGDQVARRTTNADGVGGGREERDSVQDGAGAGGELEELRRQVRITQWKADQATRKAANARGRRYPARRKGKGKR